MARIDDLVNEVPSKELQAALAEELSELRKRLPFGLVFERHLPEFAVVADQEIRPGSFATPRSDHGRRLRVLDINKGKATVVENGADDPRDVPVDELLAVRGLSEKIFPGLTSLERLERALGKPSHTVIKGENYHALQLLEFAYRGQVDCIYIDPPYNTGARNWTYNNRYIDDNDGWRHSKWLSFMEKRLRIAKRLLKADGVLIVTVDEHEVHRLGVLLDQVFPGLRSQLVTIVINPLGQARKQELGRVEEYAYVVFNRNAEPTPSVDDLLNPGEGAHPGKPRWEWLLRGGTSADRASRPNMFYPVFLDPRTRKVTSVGDPLPESGDRRSVKPPKGQVVVWPLRTDGAEGRWRLSAPTLRKRLEEGTAKVGAYDAVNDRWSLLYLGKAMLKRIEEGNLVVTGRDPVTGAVSVAYATATSAVPKTVWNRGSHRSGEYGTRLLANFLGERRFTFPKSLYAVADALRIATGSKRDALIIDFFAGSGTTLHATALLNAEDEGNRRCILVTNNEVDGETAAELHKVGHYAGDPEFEAHGVFEAVCRPRCKAALTGKRPDGKPVKGKYLDGRPYAGGFEENCEFLQLDYLDPTNVELGEEFERILPILWLIAGGIGPVHGSVDEPYSVAEGSPYALFSRARDMREFLQRLDELGAVEHLFLITDSEDAYAEWSQSLAAPGRRTHMVPVDYMTFFRRYRPSRG